MSSMQKFSLLFSGIDRYKYLIDKRQWKMSNMAKRARSNYGDRRC